MFYIIAMRINPVLNSFSYYKKNNLKLNKPENVAQQSSISHAFIPRDYFISINNINFTSNNFDYQTISSLRPTDELVGHYDDIDKFSELFSKKLDKQLMLITKEDIIRLVDEIKQQTKAPEELIKDVLYDLTMFSSYSSLSKIQKVVNKNLVNDMCLFGDEEYMLSDISSNTALNYVACEKDQIELSQHVGNKTLVVLDNTFLNSIKDFKSNDRLCADISNSTIFALNLPGWDVKCSDLKYRSANLFSGTGYLKPLAIDIIKRVQNGEKLEDILYSDYEARFKKIFKDNENNILYETYRFPIPKGKKTIDDIYDNLKNPHISKERIKKTIEEYANDDKDKVVLAKYLDEKTKIYSSESMAYELKCLYEKLMAKVSLKDIEKDDLYYYIPRNKKSFGLVNYMFSKINDIDSDKIICLNSIHNYNSRFFIFPKVILDDISASGVTQNIEQTSCEANKLIHQPDIFYTTLLRCALADSYLPPKYYLNDVTMHRINDLSQGEQTQHKLLDKNDLSNLSDLIFSGYSNCALSTAFPYMIPDNDSDIASILFANLLYKDGISANKARTVFMLEKDAESQNRYVRILNRVNDADLLRS